MPLTPETLTKLDKTNKNKTNTFQPLQTLKTSFAIFFQYKLIVIMVLCSGFYYLVFASGIILVPIITETNYQLGLDGFSTFLASQGLGALIMNLLLRFKVTKDSNQKCNQQSNLFSSLTIPFYGFMIVTSCLLMVALSNNKNMLIMFGFLGGCGLPLLDVYVPTLIQKIGESQHHGRLFAIWRLFVDLGMSIGFIISGFIAEIWQANYALVLMAAVVLPVTVYSFYQFRKNLSTMNPE